ncbi:unnamed protein product [Eruca vesicaria subsp. sativa]|uniref:Uncharacterized protein n=1 Tax=Eruca vesicaria subsp. sativa TaxID=29727 RepID=A0ABC8LTX3_ERUVS|nr:unnamed protein product [Eruca vesicaria subsp. sativa]
MNTITYAVRNLKSCITQVENMHSSGATEFDIDVLKFTSNVNISIPDTLNTKSNTFGSPTSQSPKMPSFSINLSSDDGGSSSRPIGSKKAKLKRKTKVIIWQLIL